MIRSKTFLERTSLLASASVTVTGPIIDCIQSSLSDLLAFGQSAYCHLHQNEFDLLWWQGCVQVTAKLECFAVRTGSEWLKRLCLAGEGEERARG